MEVFGWVVISIILVCAVAGAIAACWDDEKGVGKEFLEGIYSIGYIFLPVAGIMASAPFLTAFVRTVFGPLFGLIGANPAMAATTFIAVDMGGYFLARTLAATNENWITAMTAGVMAGSTIVFSIPVGLAMLQKRDHKYMALGVMAGLLSIPIGVFISNLLIWWMEPMICPTPVAGGAATEQLHMSLPTVLLNLAPLAIIMTVLAIGLKLAPNLMIRLFLGFGRVVGILVKIVVVLSIVEYFTTVTFGAGLFVTLLGAWDFDPMIVNLTKEKVVEMAREGTLKDEHFMRALEVAGYIGIMLAGAFPMVYLIRTYLSKPVEWAGKRVGLDATGAAGMLAAANILAMFRLVKDMRAKDKVLCIAFAVCAAFTFGDHLAFTTNFQPTLLLPVMAGKLCGGICGFLIATWLCVPKAIELEHQDMIDDARTVLDLMPAFKGKHTNIVKLGGGLTNRIYKLDAEGQSYVLRVFGSGTEHLGIDRDRERACSEAVASVGLGAEVAAFLPVLSPPPIEGFCGALVVRFLQGNLLKNEAVQNPETLKRIAGTIKKLHDAPIDEKVSVFCVFATIADYAEKAAGRKVNVPAEMADALTVMNRIKAEVGSAEPLCLAHNDLLAGNFVDDGTTMRVIDWEYGGRGDRFFDLGNFAANMNLTDEQERILLQAYFGEVRPEHLRRLKFMRLASDLREATWSYLQSALSKLDIDYAARGREYLSRFLAAARTEKL